MIMAIYFIAIAIAASFALSSQASLVVHPKCVPNSYENKKIYKKSDTRQKQFIDQVLQRNSSVYVKRTGFSGQAATVSFRGLNPTHSLILLDGVPLNNASSGLFDLSILQSKSIDSVKIIPGSASVLYGANAIGGVVDMTSHQATQNQNKIQIEGGSFNTFNGYTNLDRVYDSGNYTLYAEGNRTDGLPKYEKNRKFGERNKTSNGGGGAHLNHAFRMANLSLFLRGNESNLKYDASTVNIPSKPQNNQYRRTNLMGVKLTSDSKKYDYHHELLMARFNDYSKYSGASFSNHSKYYGSYKLTYYGEGNSDTNVLLTADNEFLKEQDNFKKDGAVIGTALSHNHMIFQNFFLDIGVRNDYHKTYKNHQTYSSGIRYKVKQSTFFISYRTGFRSPSLTDLYKQDGYYESNNNLGPEKSYSIETGVTTPVNKYYKIHLSYYRTVLKNRLLQTQQSNGKWKTHNVVNDTRIDGIDFQQTVNMNESLSFSLGYSLVNLDRQEPGVTTAIPRHKINGDLNWKITKEIESHLSVQWVGNRKSRSNNLRNYTIVDFNLAQHLSKTSQIYLKINNLFDERYIITPGYRTPRQEVYIGTILTF